jgi:hypothetical protein
LTDGRNPKSSKNTGGAIRDILPDRHLSKRAAMLRRIDKVNEEG